MTISANSYGDTAEVAALVPRYVNSNGEFDAVTRPKLAEVESIIDQLSGIVNAMLAEAGFTIPVSQADAKLAIDLFVNQEAAAICEGVNGYGRFGPTQGKGTQRGRWALMTDDVEKFIKTYMAGLERLGAARTYSQTAGLAYRDTDERGNETFPIFQRSGFGNAFTNWDSD